MCFCMFDMHASITKIEVVNIYQYKESGIKLNNNKIIFYFYQKLLIKYYFYAESITCIFIYNFHRTSLLIFYQHA